MKHIMIGVLLLLSACSQSNDYRPAANATGEDIFKTACIECHKPGEGGHYFKLDDGMHNVTAISNKVTHGGFGMPAFPNIQAESLQGLSEYVLSQSSNN